jgi:tRNA nucleotidyltransferase (CCA-adding enzyme)
LQSLTCELARGSRPSVTYRLLEHYSGPAIFVLWVATDSAPTREQLELYHRTLRFVEPEIDGRYLKTIGLRPGPRFGSILSTLRDARLDGEVTNLEEEERLVEQLLTQPDGF